MGRRKQRDNEKRKIILTWLNAASNLSPGNILFIPMKYSGERTQYGNLGKQIIREMEACFDKSIFHGLVIYGTSKNEIPYLAIEKPKKIMNKAFIVDRNNKEKTLVLLRKSRYTRKSQITMLLSEGYTKGEIIKALGKSITPEEQKLLE